MPKEWRCPECRSRRATFKSLLAHVQESGHKLCYCSAGPHGYHYPHRPGSPCCIHHPKVDANLIWRAYRHTENEEDRLELLVSFAWDVPGTPSTECPF